MHIYGPAHVHGAQPINAPHAPRSAAAAPQAAAAPSDELSISDAGVFLEKVHNLPDIRHERVAGLKAAIASGNYETAGRLDAALERLLDEIG